MQFSGSEIRDLVKAWVAISLAFAIAYLLGRSVTLDFPILVRAFAIFSLTVGVAFVAHEVVGHKFVAQRFHLFAEFRADDLFLVLAVLLSFFTHFVFAAPGAVVIGGVTRIDTYGKIAAAGAVVNIILAMTFGVLAKAGIDPSLPLYDTYRIGLFSIGRDINAWLALFNLFPIGILDGAKVLAWNKKVWLLLITIAALLFFRIV